MSSYPYIPFTNIFNPNDFAEIDGSLSLAAADARYLKLSGGVVYGLTTFSNSLNVIGSLSINGAPIDLSLISGVVAGVPQNGKALSLDAAGDINGDISLTGTLAAATVSSSFIDGAFYTLTGTPILMSALTGFTLGVPAASKVLSLNASGEMTSNITINRTTAGVNSEILRCVNGTTAFRVFQIFNGTTFIGNTTSTNFSFTTDNVTRMTINGSTGDISGISSLTATNLTASSLATINTALINIASINNLTNYDGKSNTAHLVIRQPSNTNGRKCAIDFMIDTSAIDASITAGASISHERSGTGSIGALIFSTKRVAGSGTAIVEALRIKSSGSCTIANTTGTDYQLDLGGTGTGINTGSLKFDGTTFNHSYFTGITVGSGDALKALVPNSDKDISGLRDLSITGSLIASTSIASPSIDGAAYSLAGSSLLMTALTDNAAGTAIAGKALVIDASRNIRFPTGSSTTGCLRWYNDTANKEDIIMYRPNDDTGLVIGTKARSIQKSSPLLWLYSGLDTSGAGAGTSSAEYKEVIRSNHKLIGLSDNYQSGWFHGYLNATPPWKASGFQYCTQFYTSMEALNITCGTSNTAGITTSNNILMQNNGKIYFNTTDRAIQSNTTFLFNGSSVVRGLGDWLEGGSQVVQEWRNSNNSTIMRVYIPNGGIGEIGMQSNDGLGLMTNNLRRLTITSAGRVGVGVDTPNAPFEVAGTNTNVTITPAGTISYSYDLSSNVWVNRGGGPFVLGNVSASFRGNLYIQAGIWATSDRRVKENIKEIDLPFERFKALKPVSYNYLNDKKSRVGFIAQDIMNVCNQAITMTNNENLKDEGLNSPAGVQLSVDYNALIALNTNIIQKLIERVEQLEAIIDKFTNKKK